MSSSLESKTIRPGSTRYSYYRSSVDEPASSPKKRHHYKLLIFIVLLLVASPIAYKTFFTANTQANPLISQTNPSKTTKAASTITKTTKTTPAVATVAPVNECADNTLNQLILVSISARHLWACNGSVTAFDSAVVTGDTQYADTITPLGTYHIYEKETDRYLRGSDENGSWDDFVYYWMPFLDNQYGAYGLHDATWRQADAFGNIDPDSSNASNGCVELPLATAKWLYNWDEVGTTVTIES